MTKNTSKAMAEIDCDDTYLAFFGNQRQHTDVAVSMRIAGTRLRNQENIKQWGDNTPRVHTE